MVIIIKKGTPKEIIKKKVDEFISRTSKKDIKKYSGTLKTSIDPIMYQREIRHEWKQ